MTKTMMTEAFEQSLTEQLDGVDSHSDRAALVVRALAETFEAQTCTLHRADGQMLGLVSHVGLPDHIAGIVKQVPFGKGMAGICAERAEPVTMCNLQTDESGVARPAAKLTGVAGAIVLPLFEGDTVVGTLGLGKPEDHEYSDDEISHLESCARIVQRILFKD